MKYKYKKQLTKIKRIFQNPGDFKYLNVNKKVKQSGMALFTLPLWPYKLHI